MSVKVAETRPAGLQLWPNRGRAVGIPAEPCRVDGVETPGGPWPYRSERPYRCGSRLEVVPAFWAGTPACVLR